MTGHPNLSHHSSPAMNHICSWLSAFKFAFPILHISISRSFNATIRNMSLAQSHDTTLEEVMHAGTDIRRPPPTYLALRVRSNFTSNMRWHGIFLYPIRTRSPSWSKNWKATSTLVISFLMSSCHRVFQLQRNSWEHIFQTSCLYILSMRSYLFWCFDIWWLTGSTMQKQVPYQYCWLWHIQLSRWDYFPWYPLVQ